VGEEEPSKRGVWKDLNRNQKNSRKKVVEETKQVLRGYLSTKPCRHYTNRKHGQQKGLLIKMEKEPGKGTRWKSPVGWIQQATALASILPGREKKHPQLE